MEFAVLASSSWLLRYLTTRVLGYDIFISYSCCSSSTDLSEAGEFNLPAYVEALFHRLEEDGFQVYFDRDATKDVDHWARIARPAAGASGLLLVVVHDIRVLDSTNVIREYRWFKSPNALRRGLQALRRSLLPGSLGTRPTFMLRHAKISQHREALMGSLSPEGAGVFRDLELGPLLDEPFTSPSPSEDTIRHIADAVRAPRRKSLVNGLLLTVGATLLVLSLLSFTYGVRARDNLSMALFRLAYAMRTEAPSPEAALLAAAVSRSASGHPMARGIALFPGMALPDAILRGHRESVLDVAFSPDGRTLASVSTDRFLSVWSLESCSTDQSKACVPRPLVWKEFDDARKITSVVYADESRLYLGTTAGSIHRCQAPWEQVSCGEVFSIGSSSHLNIDALALDQSRQWLVARLSPDPQLHIGNTDDFEGRGGAILFRLAADPDREIFEESWRAEGTYDLATFINGPRLLLGRHESGDHFACVSDVLAVRAQYPAPPGPSEFHPQDMAFRCRELDEALGKSPIIVRGHAEQPELVLASSGNVLKIWSHADEDLEYEGRCRIPLYFLNGAVVDLTVDEQAVFAATASGSLFRVNIHEDPDGSFRCSAGEVRHRTPKKATSVDNLRDLVVMGSEDCNLYLWRSQPPNTPIQLYAEANLVSSVVLSSSGIVLAGTTVFGGSTFPSLSAWKLHEEPGRLLSVDAASYGAYKGAVADLFIQTPGHGEEEAVITASRDGKVISWDLGQMGAVERGDEVDTSIIEPAFFMGSTERHSAAKARLLRDHEQVVENCVRQALTGSRRETIEIGRKEARTACLEEVAVDHEAESSPEYQGEVLNTFSDWAAGISCLPEPGCCLVGIRAGWLAEIDSSSAGDDRSCSAFVPPPSADDRLDGLRSQSVWAVQLADAGAQKYVGIGTSGGRLIVRSTKDMKDWDTWEHEMGSRIRALSFNQAGDRLAVGMDAREIVVFPISHGEGQSDEACILRGHKDRVNDISFGQTDGTAHLLASVSADGSLWLWDVNRCEPDAAWFGGGTPLLSVSVPPAGRHMLIGAAEGSVTVMPWGFVEDMVDFDEADASRMVEDYERRFSLKLMNGAPVEQYPPDSPRQSRVDSSLSENDSH